MKTCSKCGIQKPESDYFIRDKQANRLHAQCKQCYKDSRSGYYTLHYATHKQQYLLRAKSRRDAMKEEFRTNITSYLANKACIDCGESDPIVLEFDHLDPATKLFDISQAVKRGYSWAEVVEELKNVK